MTLIQSRSAIQVPAGGANSLSFNSSVTANDAIVVLGGSSNSNDMLSVSDGVNTYSPLPSVIAQSGNGVFNVFFAFGVIAGATAVTLSGLTGASSLLAIHEFSVISTFDTSNNNSGAGNTQTSNSITTAKSVELIFSFTAGTNSVNVNSISPGINWIKAESSIGSTFTFITQFKNLLSINTVASTSSTVLGKGGMYNWAAQIAGFFGSQSSNADWQLGGRRSESHFMFPGRDIDA